MKRLQCRGFRMQYLLMALIVLSLLGTFSTTAQATLTFSYNTEFSGADAPAGTPPWLTATIQDISGGVRLTMSETNLTGSEFVTGWYFNLDPIPDPITFSFVSGLSTIQATSIAVQTDSFKADGAGYFDLLFSFPTSGDRFGVGDTSVYDILGAGLDESDFNLLSTPSAKGEFLSAAKVQGIGPNAEGSGWIAPGPTKVPEPGVSVLLACIFAWGIIVSRARRKESR